MFPITRLWNVVRRARLDDELRQELDAHLALLEEDERARGLSANDARLKARSRFGSPLIYRERSLDGILATWLDTAWQDVRHGVRQLVVSPVLSAVLVVTLGLGIGATVAIFSVVNAVLLQPLPFAGSDRIVIVWETLRALTNGHVSGGHFRDWTEQNTVFEHTAAALQTTYNLADAGEPERLNGTRVTPGYFPVAGMSPVLGRYFTTEDVDARNRVIVLSQRLWERRFASDPSIIGREVRLNGEPYTVVGVAPAAFALTDPRRGVIGGFSGQVWTPLLFSAEERANYGSHQYLVLAKMKPGIARESAQRDMERVTRGIAERNPLNMESRSVNVQSFRDAVVGNVQPQLILLLAAVGFVLLIGCVNVSSLLLARATTRRKEMAIRAALGGGRGRIVRQLLTESMVFALAGGLAAIGVAELGIRFLVNMGPPELPRLRDAGLQPEVLLFALAVTVLTGVLFGLAPALRVARADLQSTLREGGRGSRSPGSWDRLRGLLVVAEIAATVVLVVGAGLFIRSAWRLQQVPLGYNPEKVTMARVSLPAARYTAPEAVTGAYRRMLEQVRSIRGVERAGASTDIPLSGAFIDVSLTVEGRTLAPGAMPAAHIHFATDGYLETAGMQLQRGRYLQESDMQAGAPRVIVVNQRLADSVWPGENPIGKRISCWTTPVVEWREVVGVVGDARTFGQSTAVEPEMFLPYTQAPDSSWGAFQRSMAIIARTAGTPADTAGSLRRAVWAVDPSLPLFAVQTLDQMLAASTDGRRFNMWLLSLLAATGLALAAVGIYGVIVFFVTERSPEIGLRLALGATAGSVIRLVLRRGVMLALAGIAMGIAGSLAATRVLTSLLFDISPTDPPSYALGALGLLVIAILASVLPAVRATRIDPVRSLSES